MSTPEAFDPVSGGPFSLPFSKSANYLALESSVARVQNVIESRGPLIVFLYGEAGAGKSTLVKHLALHYNEKRNSSRGQNLSQGETGPILDEKKMQQQGEIVQIHDEEKTRQPYVGNFSDGVYFLAMGENADIVAKQLEFLEALGLSWPGGHAPEPEICEDDISNSTVEVLLHRKLESFLENRKALIVLDDLRDPRLLDGILVRSESLKYIVTCRDGEKFLAHLMNNHGWQSFKKPVAASSLKMDHFNKQEGLAVKLLAKYTGLPDDAVPKEASEDFKNLTKKIVSVTEANPLALTNMATAIKMYYDEDVTAWLQYWKDLQDNLEDLVADSNTPVHSSTLIALDSLPVECRKLLAALYFFEGPEVPEVVVQCLMKCSKGSLPRFRRWRVYLEDIGVVHRHIRSVSWTSKKLLTLSLDCSWRLCIGEHLQWDVHSVFDDLTPKEGDPDFYLATSLCVIYGSKMVSSRATNILNKSPPEQIAQIRIWAAPYLSLLSIPDSGEHSRNCHHGASQVLVSTQCSSRTPYIARRLT